VKARFVSVPLREERGGSLVEMLLALGLVALVVAIGVQGFAYLQARSVATAAAQDGVREAIAAGPAAGLERARQVLAAGGSAAAGLKPSLNQTAAGVTVTVAGAAPGVFPLALMLPRVQSSATLPAEQYPADEQATR
jgi:type II secretory pathway pseudopilin PulG